MEEALLAMLSGRQDAVEQARRALAFDDLDALRCAKLLLDRHGRDADLYAALRVDELDAVGVKAGRWAWMRILSAVDELARTERRVDETL